MIGGGLGSFMLPADYSNKSDYVFLFFFELMEWIINDAIFM